LYHITDPLTEVDYEMWELGFWKSDIEVECYIEIWRYHTSTRFENTALMVLWHIKHPKVFIDVLDGCGNTRLWRELHNRVMGKKIDIIFSRNE
jgi:hypothetical protein